MVQHDMTKPLHIGQSVVPRLFIGDGEIRRAFIGDNLVFDSTIAAPTPTPTPTPTPSGNSVTGNPDTFSAYDFVLASGANQATATAQVNLTASSVVSWVFTKTDSGPAAQTGPASGNTTYLYLQRRSSSPLFASVSYDVTATFQGGEQITKSCTLTVEIDNASNQGN